MAGPTGLTLSGPGECQDRNSAPLKRFFQTFGTGLMAEAIAPFRCFDFEADA